MSHVSSMLTFHTLTHFYIFLIFAANAKSNHSNKRENVRRKKEAARVDESQYGSSSEDDRRAKTVKGEARGAEEIEKKSPSLVLLGILQC